MSRRGLPTGRIEEAVRGVLGALNQVVPPDAQRHLLAAQRELILAVVAMVQHHADREDDVETEPGAGRTGRSTGNHRSGSAKRTRRTSARRPTRVSLD